MPYRRPGTPYWWVKFTDASGKPTYRSTGTTDLTEAKGLEAKWKYEVHQQKLWGIQPEHSFDDMMLSYISAKQDQWRAADRAAIAVRWLQGHFTGMMVERIRRADVASYIQKRKGQGVKPTTINRELDYLSAAYNYVRTTLEWDVQNPVEGMSLPEPEGRLRFLTQAEAQMLLLEAEKEAKSPHLANFIRLALNTGCRRNELLTLTWDRVDLLAGYVRLDGENTKSGKRRFVPLNNEARGSILKCGEFHKKYCSDSPWVFAHKNGNRLQCVHNGFKAACSRAGITDFRVHDLRHTCASWLVSAGVSLSEVRDLLGHSGVEMTERYAHLAQENLKSAVGVLSRLQSGDSNSK